MISNSFVENKIIELMSGKIAIYPVISITTMAIICVAILLFKRRGVFPFIRQIIVVLLLFLLNLRILIPDANMTVTQDNLDAYVLFVVDDTISMVAEDYNGGSRMDAVKNDCAHIIDELQGARFAIISFNNDSQVMTPYSDDTTFAKSVINSIQPLQEFYATGTTLNVCKDDMIDMLVRAKESDSGNVYVFFISDGEITSDEELDSFDDAKEYVDGGAVLGYGTEEGGNMHLLNYMDEMELVMDNRDWSNPQPAVSKLDEDNLRDIARDLGVEYIHMTKQQKVNDVLDEIKDSAISQTVEKVEKNYHETYYWFAIPIAFMMIWEFVLLKRKK